MNLSMPLVRAIFLGLCVLFMTLFMTAKAPEESFYVDLGIGIISGLGFGGILILLEIVFSRVNLRSLTVITLGLFVGYLLGSAIMLTAEKALEVSGISLSTETFGLVHGCLFLICAYLGLIMTVRAAGNLALAIPFIEFKGESTNKKNDLIVDTSVLLDSRIIDLAASGLLDHRLILPHFIVKELQNMAESADETTRNKAKRALETIKKLEVTPLLGLRFSDIDYQELKSELQKLVRLASELDASILIADNARLQQSTVEDIRLINIHSLSIVLKPVAQGGEPIDIKIQRYGKEPRQGVGYLDDGTMVVVNGGAEFIGETVRAQVLSVKHTSSGRMIFCNAIDDAFLCDPNVASLQHAGSLSAPSPKSYFTA